MRERKRTRGAARRVERPLQGKCRVTVPWDTNFGRYFVLLKLSSTIVDTYIFQHSIRMSRLQTRVRVMETRSHDTITMQ